MSQPSSSYCWQYIKQQESLHSDIQRVGLSQAQIEALRVSDFEFMYIPNSDKLSCERVNRFIREHEWLGTIHMRSTHRFIATYKGIIAGAIIMATPYAFSNILGEKTRNIEKLISRGASISWAPKNLASSLVMFSIRWMVKNTPYRSFIGYSDTTAGEIGTIYQACNFIYLGQRSGERYNYFDPKRPEIGWFGERMLRKLSSYKRYAKSLGIPWEKDWNNKDKINWNVIPSSVARKLRVSVKEFESSCQRVKIPPKHKYIYLLGKSQRETKKAAQVI